MKKSAYILACLLFFVGIVSCDGDKTNPEIDLEDPAETPENPELEFKVTWADRTYSVGEAIDFTIEGNAQEIQFYSGEEGSRYEYRDEGEKIKFDKVELSFATEHSNLQTTYEKWVMISNDFDGERQNETSIKTAEWHDLTSQFSFPTSAGSRTPSGTVDLTQYAQNGPFYFAFKYVNPANSSSSYRTPSFRVYDINLKGTLENGETTDFDISSGSFPNSFVIYDLVAEDGLAYSAVLNTQLRLQPTNVLAPFASHEVWAISKMIIGDEVALPAEQGEIIQYSHQQTLDKYQYKFDTAGEYLVTFVGVDIVSKEEIVKAITIKVE